MAATYHEICFGNSDVGTTCAYSVIIMVADWCALQLTKVYYVWEFENSCLAHCPKMFCYLECLLVKYVLATCPWDASNSTLPKLDSKESPIMFLNINKLGKNKM